MLEMKAGWDKEKAAQLAEEAQRGARLMAAKQEEVEDLKQKLLVSHTGAQKARSYLARTAELVGKTRGFSRGHKAMASVMYGWRNWTRRQVLIKERIKQV